MWPWEEKKQQLIYFPLSYTTITSSICPPADFNPRPEAGTCACVSAGRAAVASPKCPSIHLPHTHTHMHHILDGGAHHNVTFNLDESTVCSEDIMDWMMVRKWIMLLRSPATSFHVSDAATLLLQSSNLAVFQNYLHLKGPKFWKRKEKIHASRCFETEETICGVEECPKGSA